MYIKINKNGQGPVKFLKSTLALVFGTIIIVMFADAIGGKWGKWMTNWWGTIVVILSVGGTIGLALWIKSLFS